MIVVSHFGLLLLFSASVSLVFAVLAKDEPSEQLTYGALLCGGFVGAGVLLSWLFFVFPL